jgi:hypothetical protein
MVALIKKMLDLAGQLLAIQIPSQLFGFLASSVSHFS